jgi:hypothetical protein
MCDIRRPAMQGEGFAKSRVPALFATVVSVDERRAPTLAKGHIGETAFLIIAM